MAEKDILEKILMSYADVFADLENTLIYSGERRLGAEELQPAPTESFYKGKNRMHNQFCDESFYLLSKRGKLRETQKPENSPYGSIVPDDGSTYRGHEIYRSDRRIDKEAGRQRR